ncbi:MAG: sugar phosphate isomerase/epimerase family protein [Limisphaerales bacterium]
MKRRSFIQKTAALMLTSAGGSLLPATRTHAIEAFQRPAQSNMKLGLAAYSLRDSFEHASHERPQAVAKDKRISLFDFLDYCASLGCDGAELTSYYFPPEVDHALLTRLKRHAFLRGLSISGTAVGNRFTDLPGSRRDQQIAHVQQWVDHAAAMGAPHVRVFAGDAPKQGSWKEAVNRCIEGLKVCCDHAATRGVFLGIENHGGIVAEADPLLEIVQAVDSPWVGINLDTGNFHTEDPYGDLVKCAPFAVNVQLKVEIAPRGQTKQPSDLARLVRILKDAHYQGHVVLEYEAAEDAWQAIPRHIAALKPLLA